MAEDVHRYFEGKTRDAHTEQINSHMKIARQRFSDDYLILSDPFIAVYEAFMKDLEPESPDEMYPDADDRFSKSVRHHRPLLLAQARKEMAARRWLWRFHRNSDFFSIYNDLLANKTLGFS